MRLFRSLLARYDPVCKVSTQYVHGRRTTVFPLQSLLLNRSVLRLLIARGVVASIWLPFRCELCPDGCDIAKAAGVENDGNFFDAEASVTCQYRIRIDTSVVYASLLSLGKEEIDQNEVDDLQDDVDDVVLQTEAKCQQCLGLCE